MSHMGAPTPLPYDLRRRAKQRQQKAAAPPQQHGNADGGLHVLFAAAWVVSDGETAASVRELQISCADPRSPEAPSKASRREGHLLSTVDDRVSSDSSCYVGMQRQVAQCAREH